MFLRRSLGPHKLCLHTAPNFTLSQVRSNAHAATRVLRQHMGDFFDDVWGGLLELCAQPAPSASSASTFARHSLNEEAYGSAEAMRLAQARWAVMRHK